MNRRSFFAALANPPPVPAKVGAMSMRQGPRGDRVSLLGYGCMRFPTKADGTIDQELVNAQVDRALTLGVNYFDTAPCYCKGKSEEAIGKALARHPRNSYYIATKLSNQHPTLFPREKSIAMYRESFKYLQVDHIDYYLVHTLGGGGFARFQKRLIDNGMLDFLMAERAAGRIRNLGFSYHGDEETFRQILATHDKVHWDFAQIQLTYVDWHHGRDTATYNKVNADILYKLLDEKGIPVTVMSPTLGGRLAKFNYALARKLVPLDPEAPLVSWAFRFAGHGPRILTVLSGMNRMEHIEENAKIFSPLKPLDAQALDALERAARAFVSNDTVPCNNCNYCMPCPYGLDIPRILSLWNEAVAEERLPDDPKDAGYDALRRRFLIDYERALPALRRADHCTGCAECVASCPHGIDIPVAVRKVDALIEKLRRNGRA